MPEDTATIACGAPPPPSIGPLPPLVPPHPELTGHLVEDEPKWQPMMERKKKIRQSTDFWESQGGSLVHLP